VGSMMYGHPDTLIEFDDRVLRHLEAVILTKLRRGEAFTAHYSNTSRNGSGHTVLWLHPSIGLRFHFDSADVEPLNRAWIAALMEGANNAGGLVLTAEPRGGMPGPPLHDDEEA
jgi:hypothetical protein